MMYGIIKNVIGNKKYELTSTIKKINTLWAEDNLSDEQRDELIALARENADPENSYATQQNQIETIFKNLGELGTTLKDVLVRLTALEGGETLPEEVEEYPAWVQPTGAHNAYHGGNKMTYTDGIRYLCVADEGIAVVWGPDTYPDYWQAVLEETETETE